MAVTVVDQVLVMAVAVVVVAMLAMADKVLSTCPVLPLLHTSVSTYTTTSPTCYHISTSHTIHQHHVPTFVIMLLPLFQELT